MKAQRKVDSLNTVGMQTRNRARTLRLPFRMEPRFSHNRGRTTIRRPTLFSNSKVAVKLSPSSTDAAEHSKDERDERDLCVIKAGVLSKTTISRKDQLKPGQTRCRHFHLTEEALEYLHQFSHVSHACYIAIVQALYTYVAMLLVYKYILLYGKLT